MMNKINSKKDLPKSFKLENYDALESLSDKDLFRQLYWRHADLEFPNDEYPEFGMEVCADYPMNDSLGDPFKEIKPSASFTKKQEEYKRKDKPDLLKLSYGEGIKPFMRFELSVLGKMESQNGYFKGMPIAVGEDELGDLFKEDNGLFWAGMREPVNLLSDIMEHVVITVDVRNCRDADLINTFKELLPLWRKELNFPEPPKPVSGGWESIRRKILDYKIIPLIDLISWERGTNSKISLGVLNVALFPNGEKDAFIIAQTIKPFLDKLIEYDSLDKIRKEISKDLN